MNKINIAILGASEIAYRRFLPALVKDNRFKYVGVGYYRVEDSEKVKLFKEKYGGEIFDSFEEVLNNPNIDAVYVPQPPALHYKYGMMVLNSNKHLFMEKPFTISFDDTKKLIDYANARNLAVCENYMFRFHKQITEFIELVNQGKVGKLIKYEVKFCFPIRQVNDFRYMKSLGGGALLDCGGYTIMLSDILTNYKGKIYPNKPIYDYGYEVDMHGSGIIVSENIRCDFYFGMNDEYCCSLKAYGDKGTLYANRILTAPNDFDVNFEYVNLNNEKEIINIGKDDSFLKSIDNFYNSIVNNDVRKDNIQKIIRQASLIDEMIKNGGY